MEMQETIHKYFDMAIDDIHKKEGTDSVFLIHGSIEQKVDLDDDWKVTKN